MEEKILHKEKIFGNLEGEFISKEDGIFFDLVINNYVEKDKPFFRMQSVESVRELRNYLDKAILLMNHYREGENAN